jgi:hypothetical protein
MQNSKAKLILERRARHLTDRNQQLIRESALFLGARGYKDDEIIDILLREGWWQSILDGTTDAVKSKISGFVTNLVLDAFDVDVTSPSGRMVQNLAIQMGENFEYTRWREYFGDGACDNWTKLVSESILEGFVIEPLFDQFMHEMGFIRSGAQSRVTRAGTDFAGPGGGIIDQVGGLIRNSVKEAVNDALTGPVSDIVGNAMCSFDMPDIMSMITGGGGERTSVARDAAGMSSSELSRAASSLAG